jgi:hypothetical protein
VVGHVRYVRLESTFVNGVESVRADFHNRRMAERTTGERLLELKARSGLALAAIARDGGYTGRSSVQAFFSESYDKPLDTEVAAKLATALVGKGTPAIERVEIFALTGAPENEVVQKFEGASMERMRQDVPILGTALGADRVVDDLAVEQIHLYTDYARTICT